MKHGLNIWWKLAFVSATLDVLTLPVWVFLCFGRFPESYPIPLVVPLCALMSLPVLYLTVFALWHWRIRYAGQRQLAWLILFVVGGVLAAAVTCGADITIWNRLQETLPHETGKVLSESSASDLWVACQIAKTTSVTCLLSALAAALGAVLIQISQRLRWRMADEQDRQRVMESMQHLPSA